MISITFFTVCEAMYGPIVERESTDTITPPWNLNASVVVPFKNCGNHGDRSRSCQRRTTTYSKRIEHGTYLDILVRVGAVSNAKRGAAHRCAREEAKADQS